MKPQKFLLATFNEDVSVRNTLWCFPWHLLMNDIPSKSGPSIISQTAINNGIRMLKKKKKFWTFFFPCLCVTSSWTMKTYRNRADIKEWDDNVCEYSEDKGVTMTKPWPKDFVDRMYEVGENREDYPEGPRHQFCANDPLSNNFDATTFLLHQLENFHL